MVLGGVLGISLAPAIKQYSGGLYKALKPIANAYANITGHRQHGLRYDDLIIEEREDVQKALSRMTPAENYDRAFRMRRAIQQSILHKPLPKAEQTSVEEDVRYLTPKINEVVKEDNERDMYDNLIIERKRH